MFGYLYEQSGIYITAPPGAACATKLIVLAELS